MITVLIQPLLIKDIFNI